MVIRESTLLQKISNNEWFWIASIIILFGIGTIGCIVIWISSISFIMKIVFTIGIMMSVTPLKYYALEQQSMM